MSEKINETEVARGLNLPSSVIEEAELMDRALCDGVFNKGN